MENVKRFIYRSIEKDLEMTTQSRTRGRPREFDQDAALTQATHLFWSKGYEATSIADLTKSMGIGSPSLYAAFGSKQELFIAVLDHYQTKNHEYVWAKFHSAQTAREAIRLYLLDLAAVLTGNVFDIPAGCMITLSSVGSEGYPDLGAIVLSARAVVLERLKTRIGQGVADGELPSGTDIHSLARFVQTIQSGMSILARDMASGEELKDVAEVAMLGWDARAGGIAPTAIG